MINAIIIYIEYLSIVKRSKIYTSKKSYCCFSKKNYLCASVVNPFKKTLDNMSDSSFCMGYRVMKINGVIYSE